MSSSIYYRLVGQATILSLHAANSVVMLISMQNEELTRDQNIKNMISMQSRYLTVWNIAFQIAYFSLAFLCDFLTVTGRDSLIPKSIRRFRSTFYTSLVFPVAALIFVIFWPIFIYDRELLFPEFIDKIFSFKSNLVMHFFILPAALWELAFLQKPVQKTHVQSVGIQILVFIVYNVFMMHTYFQNGLFPYPILKLTYGTIYFPIFLSFAFILCGSIYIIQWKIHSLFWSLERKSNEKVKSS